MWSIARVVGRTVVSSVRSIGNSSVWLAGSSRAASGVTSTLATSWKTLDDQTWEFKLRDDVKFSNGKPFTSEDVLFTICRTLNNETNVSQSYMDMTKRITDVQTPDAHTVIIKTGEPFPLMPAELAPRAQPNE